MSAIVLFATLMTDLPNSLQDPLPEEAWQQPKTFPSNLPLIDGGGGIWIGRMRARGADDAIWMTGGRDACGGGTITAWHVILFHFLNRCALRLHTQRAEGLRRFRMATSSAIIEHDPPPHAPIPTAFERVTTHAQYATI